MYQVIYKLEKQKLKYDNNYKNYKGNKKISILAKLDSDEINSDGDVFNYILIALLKKWFHYNEYNYEQWKAKSQMEVLFESMINKIMSLDSIIDIETVVEGLYVEFAFPETSYILDIKESREKEFYEKTGYKLDIQEYGMIRDFQKQEYFDWFVEQMKVVIVLNEERNKQEVFHLNQEYVSLELYQDIENKVITFIRCKYLALGDSFDLYYRALQLELPWFTDHFWNF